MMERLEDITEFDYCRVPMVPDWLDDKKQSSFGKTTDGTIKVRDYDMVSLRDALEKAPTDFPAYAVRPRRTSKALIPQRQGRHPARAAEVAMCNCRSGLTDFVVTGSHLGRTDRSEAPKLGALMPRAPSPPSRRAPRTRRAVAVARPDRADTFGRAGVEQVARLQRVDLDANSIRRATL